MEQPKVTIFNKLSEIENVASVGQTNQNVFSDFPTLTYMVVQNAIERDLDNDIAGQTIEVVIDVWTETSTRGSELLTEVEAKMRELDYTLTFSGDVPNPNKEIYHITSRFRTVNV